MNNYKYLLLAGLLSPAITFAEFEFNGELKNNFLIPSVSEVGDLHLRNSLDIDFKTDVFTKQINFNFGAEYSMETQKPEIGFPMSIDELRENNGLNIYDISLSYVDTYNLFGYKIDMGTKIGRIENKTPFTNVYNDDNRATGINKTSLEGIVGEISHKYGSSYGVLFNNFNTHEDISTFIPAMGYTMGGEIDLFGINAGLHYLSVNYDEKNIPSTQQLLFQADTKIKNFDINLDYLNQSYNMINEDTTYLGASTNVDLAIPTNIRISSKSGYSFSNFDGSVEIPVRSINNNTMKLFRTLDRGEDLVNLMKNPPSIDPVTGIITNSPKINYDRLAYGVDLDFSKVLKKDKNSLFLSIDSVDGHMVSSMTYNDIWFDSLHTSISVGQEPYYSVTRDELSTKTISISGTATYKF